MSGLCASVWGVKSTTPLRRPCEGHPSVHSSGPFAHEKEEGEEETRLIEQELVLEAIVYHCHLIEQSFNVKTREPMEPARPTESIVEAIKQLLDEFIARDEIRHQRSRAQRSAAPGARKGTLSVDDFANIVKAAPLWRSADVCPGWRLHCKASQ